MTRFNGFFESEEDKQQYLQAEKEVIKEAMENTNEISFLLTIKDLFKSFFSIFRK